MIKRNPSLTNQAKSHIKRRILNDEFENGRIPSETILADELQVSRTTIRDALSRLENEGVIFRKQGAGTFVNEPGLQIKTRLEEIWSYEDVIKAHGHTPSTQILDITTSQAPEKTAAHLEVAPQDEILHVEKLFLADGQPVILAQNCIPTALLKESYQVDDFRQPVYAFLWENGRQRLTYYLSEIVPAISTERLANTLHIQPGIPLISFTEIGYNAHNKPIMTSTSYFRDDLLRLRLIRRHAP
ncbi:MAG: GntR family transcriptional regulator [Chloroflexi bacterium]|nr:GntR family transcriptional regulator [Chloroflexota bacterium]